jgi:hypothetical protein
MKALKLSIDPWWWSWMGKSHLLTRCNNAKILYMLVSKRRKTGLAATPTLMVFI